MHSVTAAVEAISDCPAQIVDFSALREVRSARPTQRAAEEGCMRIAKVVKFRVPAAVAQQIQQAAAAEAIAVAEMVRRALWLYFRANPVEATLAEPLQGPAAGPSRALEGPSPSLPPSSPPPSSLYGRGHG